MVLAVTNLFMKLLRITITVMNTSMSGYQYNCETSYFVSINVKGVDTCEHIVKACDST